MASKCFNDHDWVAETSIKFKGKGHGLNKLA
jgi:predicted transcriptional regulator